MLLMVCSSLGNLVCGGRRNLFRIRRWRQCFHSTTGAVRYTVDAMGKRSAELLLARIQKEKGTATEVFPPELVIRASTAAPRWRSGTGTSLLASVGGFRRVTV